MKTSPLILAVVALTMAQSGAATLWQVGIDNNTQLYTPANPGDGSGGPQANFVQEIGGNNALPGNPANTGGTGVGRDIDDDYYFAGTYSTVLDGGGYTPVGPVGANEENVERAFTGSDPELRFHFNLPVSVLATDQLTVSFDFYNMDINGLPADDPALFWDVDVLMNDTLVGSFNVTNPDIQNDLNPGNYELVTPAFTLADVNGVTGPGPDNYVTLRGTNAGSSSRWMSLDYVQMDADPIPEPSALAFLGLAAIAFSIALRRRR